MCDIGLQEAVVIDEFAKHKTLGELILIDRICLLYTSPSKTFFKVILPEISPALLTGFGLAFARGIGEYGSAVSYTHLDVYKRQWLK